MTRRSISGEISQSFTALIKTNRGSLEHHFRTSRQLQVFIWGFDWFNVFLCPL